MALEHLDEQKEQSTLTEEETLQLAEDDLEDMEEFEDIEAFVERMRPVNEAALQLFVQDLVASGLSNNTISRHIFNVDVFINDYLLNYEGLEIKEGITCIDGYLGSYFIHKCMWSTPASIKTTAASIKKFYKSMLDHEKITKSDYALLCSIIKDSMAEWQTICEAYDDPYNDNPFEF